MVAFTTVVALLIAHQASPGPGPDALRDVLLTEKDAVFLLEPEAICGSGVQSLKWSPDGTYLLIQRFQLQGPHPFKLMEQGKPLNQPPSGEYQFIVHSARSGRTVPSLRLPLSSSVQKVEWLSGSSKALVLGNVMPSQPDLEPTGTVSAVYWMSASGESRKIAEAGEHEYFDLWVAPNRPMGIISRFQTVKVGDHYERKQNLQFVDSEGKTLGKMALPDITDTVVWAPDGKIYASVGKVIERKILWEWYRLNPARGTYEKAEGWKPPAENASTASEFVAESGPIPMPMKEAPPMNGVMMAVRKDPKSFVFVSTDAEAGTVSPDDKAVAYIHHGVAMVRPLARVPKQMYLEMKAAAEKAVAISNAKQAALALIMHAADNDDNMISANTNWRETVMPYIKNQKLLDGFVYTFAGGPAAQIESPAETPIGYFPGPGGKAVAYADGHVKWQPDKT